MSKPLDSEELDKLKAWINGPNEDYDVASAARRMIPRLIARVRELEEHVELLNIASDECDRQDTASRAEEREACAKVAEYLTVSAVPTERDVGRAIANFIRARGQVRT